MSDQTNMELARMYLESASRTGRAFDVLDAQTGAQLGLGFATLAVAEAIQGLRSTQPVENMRFMLHAMEKRAATRDE